MIHRLARIAAMLLVLVLLLPAVGTAEEAAEATPEGTAEEQIINPGTLPDNIRLLLETAAQEIGYTEETGGYTKYGAWTGDAYSQWCAEFVCWCVHMTDQLYGYEMLNNVYPYYTGQNTGRDWFVSRGRFVYRRGYAPGWGSQWLKKGTGLMEVNEYIPLPGDLMYFSANSTSDTVHVALVEYSAIAADGSVRVHVIEGNNPDRVARNVYALDDSKVLGFGCWFDVVDTTIKYGVSGDKVLALQQNLGKLGYLDERHFTSTCLSHTRQAVVAFQQDMGKSPTGVADRETQLAIADQILEMVFSDPDAFLVHTEE